MDIHEFPGWSTEFDLRYRQELSTHASGVVRVKDFGRPIWAASWTSRSLTPNELDRWRAEIAALGVSLETFDAGPKSRCWPIEHANGAGLGSATGTVGTVGADNRSFSLTGMPGLVLSPGDVVQVEQRMYRVLVGTEADGAGDTPEFAVAPYLWPGTAAGDVATVERPQIPMVIVPGSVSWRVGTNGRGTLSFDSVEAVLA